MIMINDGNVIEAVNANPKETMFRVNTTDPVVLEGRFNAREQPCDIDFNNMDVGFAGVLNVGKNVRLLHAWMRATTPNSMLRFYFSHGAAICGCDVTFSSLAGRCFVHNSDNVEMQDTNLHNGQQSIVPAGTTKGLKLTNVECTGNCATISGVLKDAVIDRLVARDCAIVNPKNNAHYGFIHSHSTADRLCTWNTIERTLSDFRNVDNRNPYALIESPTHVRVGDDVYTVVRYEDGVCEIDGSLQDFDGDVIVKFIQPCFIDSTVINSDAINCGNKDANTNYTYIGLEGAASGLIAGGMFKDSYCATQQPVAIYGETRGLVIANLLVAPKYDDGLRGIIVSKMMNPMMIHDLQIVNNHVPAIYPSGLYIDLSSNSEWGQSTKEATPHPLYPVDRHGYPVVQTGATQPEPVIVVPPTKTMRAELVGGGRVTLEGVTSMKELPEVL